MRQPFFPTRVKLALIPLLGLSACITPAPVGPRPVAAPAMSGAIPDNRASTSPQPPSSNPPTPMPATPTPADSATPAPSTPSPIATDTATPVSPASPSPCDSSSSMISFSVYANPENRSLAYAGTEPDLRTPLKGSSLVIGQLVRPNADFRFSVARADLNNGFEIRLPGYWPASRSKADTLCANTYVGLSPLSLEEQQGQPVKMEAQDLYAVSELPSFMSHDDASGFSYAVLRNKGDASALLTWLSQHYPGNALNKTLPPAIDGGQMIVLFSNNSSQMGDIWSVLDSAIETSNSVILASHDSGMVQFPPRNPGAFGDVFSKRLEVKLLPRSDKRIIFDAHRAGVNSAKVRLEVK